MEYLYLGHSGLRVSEMALGTQTFGWNVAESEAKQLMTAYFQQGGNYFDTADSYNGGESEKILGSWIQGNGLRNEIIIGTKVFFPTSEGPNNMGLSRKHILNSVDSSLRNLHTDFVDLLQIHCFDRRTPLEETLRTLDDLVRMGKVRYIGASNFTPSTLMKFQMLAKAGGMIPFSSLQLEYSLLVRSPEWELIPLCHEEGIGMLVWSPLAGGWLTGKYRRGENIPKDSRAGKGDRWDDSESQRATDKAYDIIDTLVAIATESGHSVSQVSLNWTMQKTGNAIPLIGVRSEKQLEENLGALSWKLSNEQLHRLDDASNIKTPSPYNFIERYTRG
jgi:aryl-alcohol dehydrogenase-like predicted oxidoreductase